MSQGVKFILEGRKPLRRKSGIFFKVILLVSGTITGTIKKTVFPLCNQSVMSIIN